MLLLLLLCTNEATLFHTWPLIVPARLATNSSVSHLQICRPVPTRATLATSQPISCDVDQARSALTTKKHLDGRLASPKLLGREL